MPRPQTINGCRVVPYTDKSRRRLVFRDLRLIGRLIPKELGRGWEVLPMPRLTKKRDGTALIKDERRLRAELCCNGHADTLASGVESLKFLDDTLDCWNREFHALDNADASRCYLGKEPTVPQSTESKEP